MTPVNATWKAPGEEVLSAVFVPGKVLGELELVYARVAQKRDLRKCSGVSGPALTAYLFARCDGTVPLNEASSSLVAVFV